MISVVHTTGDRLTRKLASMSILPGAPQASHAPRDKPDPAPAPRPEEPMCRPPEGPGTGSEGFRGTPRANTTGHGEGGRKPPSNISRLGTVRACRHRQLWGPGAASSVGRTGYRWM